MKILSLVVTALLFTPLALSAYNFMKQKAEESNVLIYGDNVQVSAEINVYENIMPNQPIPVSLMVTHDANNLVDANSFTLGDKPLNVNFVKTMDMSPDSQLVVSVYSIQLEGMKTGIQTLPGIKVKVGNKYYVSPALVVRVN